MKRVIMKALPGQNGKAVNMLRMEDQARLPSQRTNGTKVNMTKTDARISSATAKAVIHFVPVLRLIMSAAIERGTEAQPAMNTGHESIKS